MMQVTYHNQSPSVMCNTSPENEEMSLKIVYGITYLTPFVDLIKFYAVLSTMSNYQCSQALKILARHQLKHHLWRVEIP